MRVGRTASLQGDIMAAALLLIAFISLIGVRFIPHSGRFRHAWFVFCIINLTVAAILYLGSFKKDQKISTLESNLVAVREYSAVARRDALGNPAGAGIGSDIKFDDDLTKSLEDMYTTKDNRIRMRRGPEAEQRYCEVIQKFPKFPFGHYFLALCLRERGDQEWPKHASRAVEILKLTTQIDGHSSNHDEVLEKLCAWLEEE